MRAMIFEGAHTPLSLCEIPIPKPKNVDILIQVKACGLCRTDLHIFDGELAKPKERLILGHQIVGVIVACGTAVKNFRIGERVGVPWLGQSCGICFYCHRNQENLCDKAQYTGYNFDGGFAEYCVANSNFCFPIPDEYDDIAAAPLLCAGLIGFRALSKVAFAHKIGFYGFGSSAHILAQIIKHQKKDFYAFTREKDRDAQKLAFDLGATWAGSSKEILDVQLDAAIIFAPDGSLIPYALKNVRKNGTVVCAGIHMTDIPAFPYSLLWGERHICSVANLTRKDGEEFFKVASLVPIKTKVKLYQLLEANEALKDLRNGKFAGSAVIDLNLNTQRRKAII
jgi:alcohol dehydrogenase, propanol-preferring